MVLPYRSYYYCGFIYDTNQARSIEIVYSNVTWHLGLLVQPPVCRGMLQQKIKSRHSHRKERKQQQ